VAALREVFHLWRLKGDAALAAVEEDRDLCLKLTRFVTIDTRLTGLREKDKGAYHEAAHSA
jgi:hypothetical protein